ncbi:MAG TPA: hypothetical protein VL970_03940, partial [Candidatus Acidoferrales bacterium]|nr:hypothetical protein [Candidatus Acidoferrales bacterium]
DFKQARARFLALQTNQAPAAQSQMTVGQTNSGTIRVPGTIITSEGKVVGRTGAAAVEQNMVTAAAMSNHVEAANLKQLAVLGSYLATFPQTNIYCLDHFAMRTGKVVDGLEVYDLGTAAGLNY